MPHQDLERLIRLRRLLATGEAKTLREAADVSQREMAEACGVDTATIWRWENRRRTPRGATAIRYAAALEMLSKAAA